MTTDQCSVHCILYNCILLLIVVVQKGSSFTFLSPARTFLQKAALYILHCTHYAFYSLHTTYSVHKIYSKVYTLKTVYTYYSVGGSVHQTLYSLEYKFHTVSVDKTPKTAHCTAIFQLHTADCRLNTKHYTLPTTDYTFHTTH